LIDCHDGGRGQQRTLLQDVDLRKQESNAYGKSNTEGNQ